jgi:ABC-type bacteriocin/lantibiotic exporter with double-glycine peptidase domain
MAGPNIEGKLSPVQRFIRLLKLDKKAIGQLYFYAIFQGLVALSLPLGIQAIINLIQSATLPTSWTVLVFIVILGIVVSGVLFIMQLHISENLQQRIFTRAAFEFAYRIPKIRYDVLHNKYVPEIVNRFFDIISVQKGISKILLDFSSAVLQITFGIILLSFYHPFFILFGFLLVAIVLLILKVWGPRGLATSLDESAQKYDVAFWLEEIARSLRVFKMSGDSTFHLKRLDKHVKSYLQFRNLHFKILIYQYISLVGFKAIVGGGLLILGSILVINQQINLGQFVAAEIVLLLVVSSVEKVIISMQDIYDILTAVEKVGSVTDWPLETESGINPIKTKSAYGFSLETNDLHYVYPDGEKTAFKSLNLHINAGEKWCISGTNGSGKSTLIHVLAGFYSNFQGTLLVNGVSLHTIDMDIFRQFLGTCLTDEEIFNGTLRDNITIGRKDISDDEILHLSEKLFWDKSLKDLTEGLDTWINPDGKKLPRSLVRKIILTRALACKPKLVLIEDNLHHIDEKERMGIWDVLTDASQAYTLIAISSDEQVKNLFSKQIEL